MVWGSGALSSIDLRAPWHADSRTAGGSLRERWSEKTEHDGRALAWFEEGMGDDGFRER